MKKIILTACLVFTSLAVAQTVDIAKEAKRFREAVINAKELARDPEVQRLAIGHGLQVMSFAWEDTGRQKGSSFGPNITDLSIQVHTVNDQGVTVPELMPIFRHGNFDDKIAELSPNEFFVLVGNEKGGDLKPISLTQYLSDFGKYLSKPEAWKGGETSLMLPRDSSVIVSAQHSILPVPKGQKATFNPVAFNYQSEENNSAVLTIVATANGTSATIINNTRDGFETPATSGQRLFFNQDGERASFTGTRLSDFIANQEAGEQATSSPAAEVSANNISGKNMVLIIQVPLVHENRGLVLPGGIALESLAFSRSAVSAGPDVEEAVIGVGELEGPFTEIDEENSLGEDQQVIKRDSRFPIRVTVQFYHATENGVLDAALMKKMRGEINAVYNNAKFVGSLVTEGETGSVLEHDVECDFRTWRRFWNRYYPIALERQSKGELNPKVELSVTPDWTPHILPTFYPKWGPYWTYFCRDEVQLERAVDHALGYTATAEEAKEE